MKTKVKVIASAAVVAALTAGIVATASADTVRKMTVLEAEATQIVLENGLTDFELAILEGKKPCDPNSVINHDQHDGAVYPLDLAQSNDSIKLTLVQGPEDGYRLWFGRVETNNVAGFSMTYIDP